MEGRRKKRRKEGEGVDECVGLREGKGEKERKGGRKGREEEEEGTRRYKKESIIIFTPQDKTETVCGG